MVDYTTIILQHGEAGDKTGWTYIEIPADVGQQIKPGNKRAVRVRGWLDNFAVSGMSLLPIGKGKFILALRQEIRKAIRKKSGAMLRVRLEFDADFKMDIPEDLQDCLDFEPDASAFFHSLTPSHRGYFIKWINDAKTESTKANRIANTVNAMMRRMDYGAMLREQKKLREG